MSRWELRAEDVRRHVESGVPLRRGTARLRPAVYADPFVLASTGNACRVDAAFTAWHQTFVRTKCGAYLRDPEAVNVEMAEDFCDRCLFADHSIVYTFRGAGDAPLYVGRTTHPQIRLDQHRRAAPWWFWTVRSGAKCVDPKDAPATELATIRALSPSYNVTGVRP